MTIEQIRSIIPHRYPFLLIDRVVDCVPGQSAVATKCVSANEPYFEGHFPHRPVMPGVLIIEALAQAGAVALLSKEEHRGKTALFAGIERARFRRQVVPGDVLTLDVQILNMRGRIGKGQARAYVGESLAAEATLLFYLDS